MKQIRLRIEMDACVWELFVIVEVSKVFFIFHKLRSISSITAVELVALLADTSTLSV